MEKLIGATKIKTNQSSEELFSFEEALEHFNGSLIWRSVHALMDHQDFKSSPLWFSRKMGVSVEEVVEALEGLERLGLIRKTEAGYEQREAQFIIPENKSKLPSRQQDHNRISNQMLNKLLPNRSTVFRNGLFVTNKETVMEFYEDVQKAFAKFRSNSDGGKKDSLFGFSFTGVDLMESLDKDGGEK